jgi:hypothetical protein
MPAYIEAGKYKLFTNQRENQQNSDSLWAGQKGRDIGMVLFFIGTWSWFS